MVGGGGGVGGRGAGALEEEPRYIQLMAERESIPLSLLREFHPHSRLPLFFRTFSQRISNRRRGDEKKVVMHDKENFFSVYAHATYSYIYIFAGKARVSAREKRRKRGNF